MRHLMFEGVGRLAFRETPEPVLFGPAEALVRPLAVARCDLDAAIVKGRAPFRSRGLHRVRAHVPALFRKLPFGPPFALGHECVAEVISVGETVVSVCPGDRVVVPFQVSCGTCDRCLRGVTASCSTVEHAASFGLGRGAWGGVLADVVRIPFADAMLLKAPTHVPSLELASAGDNVADGYRTVAKYLAERPGAPVLVVGGEASSVGLYAVLCALALGSSQVDYLDHNPVRLRLAESVGARIIEGKYRKQARAYPITVDASADRDGLSAAILSTEPGGHCTSVGIYFERSTPFPLLPAFMNGITFHTSRVCSRTMLPKVLELIGNGKLVPSRVTTLAAPWDDAPEALLHDGPKVLIHRA
jgi:threonine dehydrogenase-like Zn-dependent dehydrogenase